jgi:predicted transglutaminase-like cysteine proteinase
MKQLKTKLLSLFLLPVLLDAAPVVTGKDIFNLQVEELAVKERQFVFISGLIAHSSYKIIEYRIKRISATEQSINVKIEKVSDSSQWGSGNLMVVIPVLSSDSIITLNETDYILWRRKNSKP